MGYFNANRYHIIMDGNVIKITLHCALNPSMKEFQKEIERQVNLCLDGHGIRCDWYGSAYDQYYMDAHTWFRLREEDALFVTLAYDRYYDHLAGTMERIISDEWGEHKLWRI